MAADCLVLIINPGSTSTKVAIGQSEAELVQTGIQHPAAVLAEFASVWDQYDLRREAVLAWLQEQGIAPGQLDLIVARGGTLKPIPGGTYRITPPMLFDMRSGRYGHHACSVGCQIAYDLGQELGIPALTEDPPTTDEMDPLARYSGLPAIQRQSSFHALSQKATARWIAGELSQPYASLKLIIAHLGGGISVGVHRQGRVVDVNNALDGDGPFAIERAGGLPASGLIRLCFSGQYTQDEVYRLVSGQGGLAAYLGTKDGMEIEARIGQGDAAAAEAFAAMGYQIAKEIGAAAVVLDGRVDAIGITGGLARSRRLMAYLSEKIGFIAPIHVYPGEKEMEALREGALRFWRGEEPLLDYGEGGEAG